MALNLKKSLATTTLLHMALRISAVVCAVTGLAYVHLQHTLREETEHQLRAYTEQRLARERSNFDLAAEYGKSFRDDYVRRLKSFSAPDLEQRYDSLVTSWGDGTFRTPKQGFDQKTQIGIFVGPQQTIDHEFKRRLVLSQELLDRSGPLVVSRFPDFYLTMPGNVMVIYWPDSPWVMDMASDFDMRKEPYLSVADHEHNPRGEQTWTPIYYDAVGKVWMMSFETPIYVDGQHIATIGQDLLLDDFLKRTATESLPGAHNVIFRKGGQLIFAPGLTERILKTEGKLSIADTKDPELGAILDESSRGATLRVAEVGSNLAGVAFIPGPNWFFVTVYPKSLITSRALVAARVIFALGLCSLVLELLVLYFVLKKSVARPLGQLTRTTEVLAAGDLAVRSDLQREDEVGLLASAFNQMASAIQSRDERLARHTEELEHKVEERTQALGRRNHDMRLVLDTVEQGFVTIDLGGGMSKERSKIVERWLGSAESESFVDYLRRADPATAEWLALGLEAIAEDVLPAELTLSQLPQRTRAGDAVLELGYVPIYGDRGEISKLLVVMTDVTTRLERERLEVDQREVVAIFQHVSKDAHGFGDFFTETTRMVETLGREAMDHAHAMRLIHTIKGNAAFFGISSMSSVCHTVEEAVREEGQLTEALVRKVEVAWASVGAKVSTLLPDRHETIEVSRSDYDELVRRVRAAVPAKALLETLDTWTLEPADRRLAWLSGQARAIAERLGKGEIHVHTQSNGLRLEPQHWTSLWAVLVHLVRNAVDHGIETVADRIAQGKSDLATIRLETRLVGEELTFVVEDDGRGVDWSRVAERAKTLGLPHTTRSDLERALFAQGMSTKDKVTELSGAGIGMAAVLGEVRARSGKVTVTSSEGHGTRVECRLPLKLPSSNQVLRVSGGRVASAAE